MLIIQGMFLVSTKVFALFLRYFVRVFDLIIYPSQLLTADIYIKCMTCVVGHVSESTRKNQF